MRKVSLLAAALTCSAVLAPVSASAATFTGAGFSIPNASAGVAGTASSSVTVFPISQVTSFTVTLNNLNHTWAGDLIATLTHAGTTYTLFDRLGVPPSNVGNSMSFNGNYTFSNAATMTLPETSTGTNDIIQPGTYSPAAPFTFGGDSAGNWTLTISDNAALDTGSLGSWTLNINEATTAVPEPATWAMMLIGFGGIGFAMRRRKSKVTTTVAYA